MTHRSHLPILSWGLGFITLVVLFAHLPDRATLDIRAWVFFAGFVALMLNLGTMFNEGVVSPASTAALMGYLTLSEDRFGSAALWCVAAGSLIGNLVWLLRTRPSHYSRREYARVIKSITVGTAQLTLGVFLGGLAYSLLDGHLPLETLDESDILPLIAFVLTFLLAYLGILFLEAYLLRRRTPLAVVRDWRGGVEVLLLPLPFAAVGAVAYHQLSSLAFIILIGGLLIIVTGVNVTTRTQSRYRQQVLELSSLSAISQAMRTNQDLNALLDVVAQQVTYLLDVGSLTIALFDSSRNVVYFPLNMRRHQPETLEPREAGQGLIEHVIHTQTPFLIEDRVSERATQMGLTPPDMPVYSWMGAPLLAADRVLGCMAVLSSKPDRLFSTKDLHLLTMVAAQTGISLDNSQLYEQARDRSMQLATLNNVANILSGTLDVQQILELAGSSAVAVAGCNAIALHMWWEGTHRPLTLARQTGLDDEFVQHPARPLMMDIDDLQRRRQPILVSDVHTDQRTADLRGAMDRQNKRAWAEFLLRKGDDLLGIIIFYYNEPRHFAGEEVELLRNFTNQAALAISNARLYTQTDAALNRRVEQLSALADTTRELTSTLNLPGLFQLVLDRALEATQSRNGFLLLRVDDEHVNPSLVAYRGFPATIADQLTPLTGYVAQTYQTGIPTLLADLLQEDDYVPLDSRTRAQLNVPVMRGEEVLGVISLGSDRPNDYTADDLSFVTQLATQARIAIDNAQLFRSIEIARDRLQVILDSMKEGVILIGAEGRITLANPRVRLLLGLPPDVIMQKPVVDLVEDTTLCLADRLGFSTEVLLNLVRMLVEGRWEGSTRDGNRFTFELTTDTRIRYIDRTITPVRDERGSAIGMLMVFSDVTEERELSQAREDLSSMIVHDLRGPLTAISTSLKLLNEIAPDDPFGMAIRQTVESSNRAMRKLLNLVDSLLDVSKLESGVITLETEPTKLQGICVSVLDEMIPVAHELEVMLKLEIAEDLPLLNIDPEKTERVLLNLVDNAIKFTPARGDVTVRAHPAGAHGAAADFIRVDVADTGPGIPDEHKDRLFDRFAQIDGRRGRRRGTGLGLTFCKLAVEAHGGAIWIEDNPQGGSIFTFTLPVADIEELLLPDD